MGSIAEDSFLIIDFSGCEKHPQETARALFDAASRWGFLVLTGHGISDADVDHMFSLVSYRSTRQMFAQIDIAQSKEFFSQPQEIKEEKWMDTMQIGYDYKESV
jgi:isopenicillin N synthase-like dioxygenase